MGAAASGFRPVLTRLHLAACRCPDGDPEMRPYRPHVNRSPAHRAFRRKKTARPKHVPQYCYAHIFNGRISAKHSVQQALDAHCGCWHEACAPGLRRAMFWYRCPGDRFRRIRSAAACCRAVTDHEIACPKMFFWGCRRHRFCPAACHNKDRPAQCTYGAGSACGCVQP